jgi:hypothetical protein
MKFIVVLLTILVLIVMISVWAVPVSSYIRSIMAWRHIEQQTVELLRREAVKFLVTDRLMTSIVVKSIDQNWLWGGREGYLIATVKVYLGIDLETINEDDITRDLGKVIVKLPEPELLDFAVDYARTRVLTRRSGLLIIADLIRNSDMRDDLYKKLRKETVDQLKEYQMFPSREELVARLNRYSPVLRSQLGVELVFI